MTNGTSGIQRAIINKINIKVDQLSTITSFSYLSTVFSNEQTAVLTKLFPVWRDNTISLRSEVMRFAQRSKQPLETMVNSRFWSRNGNLSGLAMSQGVLAS